MKAIHRYFTTHKKVTLTWMWIFFFLDLGYMLLHIAGMISTGFWLWLIPGAVALYLRIAYSKAAYDPARDKFSDKYIPRDLRK